MNSFGTNIFLLVSGAIVVPLLVWLLADGLQRGRFPVRGGGWVKRATQPVSYWSMAVAAVALIVLGASSVLLALFDLLGWREQVAVVLAGYRTVAPGMAAVGIAVLAAMTVYCAWLLADGLWTGRIGYRDGWAVRETQPLGYWLLVAMLGALVSGFGYVLLRLLLG